MDGESFNGKSIDPWHQYVCNTKALLQSMPLSAWLAILQFWRLVTPPWWHHMCHLWNKTRIAKWCLYKYIESEIFEGLICVLPCSTSGLEILGWLHNYFTFSLSDLFWNRLGTRNISRVHLDPSFQPCGQGFSWYVCCLSYFNHESSQKHQGVFRDAPPNPNRLVLKSIPWCVSSTWPVPYKVVKMIFGKKVRSTRNICYLYPEMVNVRDSLYSNY